MPYNSLLASRGILVEPRKVKSIRTVNIPDEISEVKAMKNYVGWFIPKFNTTTERLRLYTLQRVTLIWTKTIV